METLEFVFADGRPGRLYGEEGLRTETGAPVVLCLDLSDNSEVAASEAGTLYVRQDPGDVESPLVAPAREGGFTIEVQVAESITLPPPDPPVRRRRSED